MSTATTIEPDVSETDLATTVRGARSKAQNAIDDVIAAVPSAAADGREVMDDLAPETQACTRPRPRRGDVVLGGAWLGLLIGGAPRAWPSPDSCQRWRSASRSSIGARHRAERRSDEALDLSGRGLLHAHAPFKCRVAPRSKPEPGRDPGNSGSQGRCDFGLDMRTPTASAVGVAPG